MIKTVPCSDEVRCTVRKQIRAQCPIQDELDTYDLTVSWTTNPDTIEKHSLDEYLNSLQGTERTQEALAAAIADELAALAVRSPEVRLEDTRHMDMVVTA